MTFLSNPYLRRRLRKRNPSETERWVSCPPFTIWVIQHQHHHSTLRDGKKNWGDLKLPKSKKTSDWCEDWLVMNILGRKNTKWCSTIYSWYPQNIPIISQDWLWFFQSDPPDPWTVSRHRRQRAAVAPAASMLTVCFWWDVPYAVN